MTKSKFPPRKPRTDGVVPVPTMTKPLQTVFESLEQMHTWLCIGTRRWCRQCGSFQVQDSAGKWRDAMVGPWPGYNPTDSSRHDD